MRIAITAVSIITALTLGACASTVTNNRYESEYRQLSEDCRTRGGILATTGQQSGRPQLDNVCEIRGEPSDRIRSSAS